MRDFREIASDIAEDLLGDSSDFYSEVDDNYDCDCREYQDFMDKWEGQYAENAYDKMRDDVKARALKDLEDGYSEDETIEDVSDLVEELWQEAVDDVGEHCSGDDDEDDD